MRSITHHQGILRTRINIILLTASLLLIPQLSHGDMDYHELLTEYGYAHHLGSYNHAFKSDDYEYVYYSSGIYLVVITSTAFQSTNGWPPLSVVQCRYSCQLLGPVRNILGDYNDPVFPGEVVGRDLNVSIASSWEGHVGIWTGLRMIDASPRDGSNDVREISLYSFKNAEHGNYWGARSYRNRSEPAVVTAATTQTQFPTNYTYGTSYRAGGQTQGQRWDRDLHQWVSDTIEVEGKFRCDTFVNYSYHEGTRLHLIRMTPYYERTRDVSDNLVISTAYREDETISPTRIFYSLRYSR